MFIRTRKTPTGFTATTLMESYRCPETGRPKHRIIANLHGAATLFDALAEAYLEVAYRKAWMERHQRELAQAEEQLDTMRKQGWRRPAREERSVSGRKTEVKKAEQDLQRAEKRVGELLDVHRRYLGEPEEALLRERVQAAQKARAARGAETNARISEAIRAMRETQAEPR